FQTATFLLALGIGLVMSVPEVQPMKMLRGNSAAAALVRRALPFIILLPLIVGWLRLQGENSGMYDSAFGIALRTVVEVVLLVGLLWWAASAVKARETPLRESEELSRTLFNSAPMAILSCDRYGVVQHYNRRAVELWGREPARGIERNSGSVKLWRPDGTFLPREQSPMVEVLRTGIPTHNVELFIERPDGSRLPILANFVALKNQQGDITGAIASFIDISERKQTEMNLSFLASVSQDLAQLKTVDEMMRNVGAKIGTHFHLSLCNFVEINEAANEAVVTHNWHREDVPGIVGVYKLSEYLTDDFQKTCRAGELFIVRDSATDPRTDAEKYAALQLRSFVCVPQMRNDQWKFLLNVHDSKPRDWRGDEIELIREVAARLWSRLERVRAEEALRESEKKFRAMADSIPQLAWTADATGFIHWYNRRWYEYTGTTLKDMEGWGWQSVHDPKALPKVMERWQASIATGDSLDMVFPLRRADGQFRSFLTRVNPLKDDQGRVVQWFGTNTDIEDQKHAEEKLERTVAQRTEALRETNEQLEAFVYSISHDLRAPLRSMQGFSQLLVDDHAATLDDAAKNYLARINRSAEFMDKLIMDLLAFGRTSRAEMELASVQVQKAWDNALFQCGTEIERTKAKIEAIPPLPTVHAHEATLSQALANLLSNALKFVSPGVAPHIRFWAEENGDAVRLWIQDNGLGIPKEQHERVFRVFERLQSARYPGTGIGLSIVRKGVERMNGKMGLESEPGQGSRFWIELPKG
ncbi:MAG: PAS domain S-box protein, partial [Verrucomicrobiota bacterium]